MLGDRPRYTPTSIFETFPLPWPPGTETEDDLGVQAIAEAARQLNELRHNWLNLEEATLAELKKRTLRILYNQRGSLSCLRAKRWPWVSGGSPLAR